jgi:hypothetical protein
MNEHNGAVGSSHEGDDTSAASPPRADWSRRTSAGAALVLAGLLSVVGVAAAEPPLTQGNANVIVDFTPIRPETCGLFGCDVDRNAFVTGAHRGDVLLVKDCADGFARLEGIFSPDDLAPDGTVKQLSTAFIARAPSRPGPRRRPASRKAAAAGRSTCGPPDRVADRPN